ncbi:hypothetical protein, partial [Nocardia abscessus]|uniref:hypothetical protein n=1 Tax=Nocardia abscessus TaxID=120957 RepID=UPI003CC7FD22
MTGAGGAGGGGAAGGRGGGRPGGFGGFRRAPAAHDPIDSGQPHQPPDLVTAEIVAPAAGGVPEFAH